MGSKYKVVKRSQEVVDFDIIKIRNVIEWAVKGLDVNPMKLESNLKMILKPKMTSIEIHKMVIRSALELTSLEEPEWSQVASRLKVISMYKDACQTRDYSKFGYDTYTRFLKQAVKANLYDKVILEKYSPEELKEAGKMINPEYDLIFDFAGMNILDVRYLIKNEGKIFELPQEAFLTIALLIEQDQKKSVRMKRVKDTYLKLATRRISLATPILSNLRRPDGNLSSCFITAADDDLASIYYVNDQCSRISKNGGGVGINLSGVRSSGSSIQGIPNASGGVIPWAKNLNNTAVAVNQLGKRAGAFTVSLDIWHSDIPDWLEIQTENGSLSRKAYEIFPQIVVVDEFMKRVENDDYWYLFDPHEVKKKFNIDLVYIWGEKFSKEYNNLVELVENTLDEYKVAHKRAVGEDFEHKLRTVINDENKNKTPTLVKKFKAKEILTHIMKVAVETGMPFISFKDTINRYNPNMNSGVILAGNLCMESFSNTSPSIVHKDYYDEKENVIVRKITPGDLHTCNLASINLAHTPEEEFEDVAKTSVRILDNLIDLTTAPILEGFLHNDKYRTIGVGFMGYADYLAKNKVQYEESSDVADELFEKFALYCTRASMELAKERGSFKDFENSQYTKGIILGKNKTWFRNNSKLHKEWSELIDSIKDFGIRNSQITAIAPNTSTSLVQGATPSVLPIFGKLYQDNGKTTVPITPPFIKNSFWFYKENKVINQRKLIDVISKIQKWIDTGISMELILNPNLDYVDAVHFYNMIMDAWKKECKTIYYIRSVQKGSDLEKGEESCSSCAG